MFDFKLNELIAALGLLLMALISLVLWLVMRRRRRQRAALLSKLLFFYLLCSLGMELAAWSASTKFGSISTMLVWPVGLVQTVIGLVFAIVIILKYFPNEMVPRDAIVDYSSPDVLKNAVSTIFDSQLFLTTLRGTLPQGKDDQKFGLDYIPFMLQSIDERRERAAKSAQLFFWATIFTAVVFSSVVGYFGYILVNESAAGSAKYLFEIRQNTQKLADTLPLLAQSYSNPAFLDNVQPSLTVLAHASPGAGNSALAQKVAEAIAESSRTGDLSPLQGVLANASLNVSGGGKEESQYAAVLNDANNRLQRFLGQQSTAMIQLRDRLADLTPLIANADKAISTPEYRTSELIKRLGLGIVVSTFFLALLRYVGNLYRTRYQQVIDAERDDFMVRRFYVALKNSDRTIDQRTAVLNSFMAGPSTAVVNGDVPGADDSSKQALDLMKELVAALSKKI